MNKRFSLLLAPLALLAAHAHAAVPADVTTAITDMKADGMTVATAVLVAVIAVSAIKFIRRGISG
ncbi:major capsid protein [Paucibacter sediminis]|uniref:Major capsid protein n=1 Tax=Paucibacter sediminis TaxID=3019553 RepID=A0AA95NBQ8_9BURK|nr:major capsid protein [Paucibacter sp. S2-9]WIT11124.1 major capsid protein [Paucibacter sp. S2-9]